MRNLPDVDVAVICGKNRLLHRRLSRLSARYRGRLSVHGFVTDMGGWLRAADVLGISTALHDKAVGQSQDAMRRDDPRLLSGTDTDGDAVACDQAG